MKKFMFYTLADYDVLQKKLEKYASNGLELSSNDGFKLFADFKPSKRNELQYETAISPINRSANDAQNEVEERKKMGWEAIATINGIDIYKSRPCENPQYCDNIKTLKNAVFPMIISDVLLLLLSVFCCSYSQFSKLWFVSDFTAFLYLSRFPVLIISAFWIISLFVKIVLKKSLKSEITALIRSISVILTAVWLATLIIIAVFSSVHSTSTNYYTNAESDFLESDIFISEASKLEELGLNFNNSGFTSAEYSKTSSAIASQELYLVKWDDTQIYVEDYTCSNKLAFNIINSELSKANYANYYTEGNEIIIYSVRN